MKRKKGRGKRVTLAGAGEEGVLEEIAASFDGMEGDELLGIGDDCALIEGRGDTYLFTTDLLTEGVHFRKGWTTPYKLGWKAVAVNLSDIGAMGGIPLHFLASLGIPEDTGLDYIESLYKGMKALAGPYCISLIGGNISSSPVISVSLFMVGRMGGVRPIFRKGARRGDIIFVTGHTGDSAMGLLTLKRGLRWRDGRVRRVRRRHLTPSPPMRLARELALSGIPSSMIDLSDGFQRDLSNLLSGQGLGAEVNLNSLPLSGDLLSLASDLGVDPLPIALGGGEDCGLLFTAGEERKKTLLGLSSRHSTPITAVGVVTDQGRIAYLHEDGREWGPPPAGFDHFRSDTDSGE